MTSTINAFSSGSGGITQTADASGILALQTNGTTAVTVGTDQNVTMVGTATAAKLIPTGTSVTGNGMYLPATNSVGISTAGTNAVYIDASQQVGIGTSSPGAKLSISGINNSGTLYALSLNNTPDTAGNGVGIQFQQAGNSTNFIRSNYIGSWGLSFGYGTTEAVRITGAGDVGIGTNAPKLKTHIQAAASSPATSGTTPTGSFLIDVASGSYGLYAGIYGTGTFGPWLQASDKNNLGTYGDIVINPLGGNLLVGVDSSLNSGKVTVRTPTAFTGYGFRSDSVTAAGTTWGHFYGTSSTNSVANIIIYGNGNVVNANNSYGALSDIKLKENIVDASPKLANLMQVRIVNYNLKGAAGYETHKQIGVVAQELEQVFPGMVEETTDIDVEGNLLDTTTKSVKYSVFVPMLIKAIQEQQALITQLQADVAALKGA